MRRKAPAPEGITAASSNDRLSRGLAAAGLACAPLLEIVRTCACALLLELVRTCALYIWARDGVKIFSRAFEPVLQKF